MRENKREEEKMRGENKREMKLLSTEAILGSCEKVGSLKHREY